MLYKSKLFVRRFLVAVRRTLNEATEPVSETIPSVSSYVIPSHILIDRFSVGAPVARSVASSRAKTFLTGYDERSVVVSTKGRGVFLTAQFP